MVDGLGVGNPQAVFLHNSISAMTTPRQIPWEEAHPKRPVPARYSSVFFQKLLFDGSGLPIQPPPCMSCFEFCERMSLNLRGRKDTVYPRWILRSWDITDRRGAMVFIPGVGHYGSADCQCCLVRVHLEAGRGGPYFPLVRRITTYMRIVN